MTELARALDGLRGGARRRSWRPAAVAAVGAGIAALAGWVVFRPWRPVSLSRSAEMTAAVAEQAPTPVRGPPAPTPAALPPSKIAPAARVVSVIKHARSGARARRSSASGTAPSAAVPSPVTPAPSSPPAAEPAQTDATPFARPATSRARQADDLVDPF